MFLNYLKLTYKVLLRRKFFTIVSLFAISFTLMVLLIAASLLDHLFGPHDPEQFADRSIGIYGTTAKKEFPNGGMATTNGFAGYYTLNRYAKTLETPEMVSIATFPSSAYTYNKGEKTKIFYKYTDHVFWEVFKFNFLEGQPFTTEDEANQNFVAVINESTRLKFFGNNSALNQTLEFNGKRYTVIGVVSDIPFLRQVPFSDVWVPVSTMPNIKHNKDVTGNFLATIVARSPEDIDLIVKEFDDKIKQFEFPDDQWEIIEVTAESLFDFVSRMLLDEQTNETRRLSLFSILIGAALLFMLLPTINLININVSRIYERSSEIGVRKSFGASSWQLVNQFLVENLIITLIGSLIGLILSMAALAFINYAGWIPYSDLSVNFRIFLYGLVMTFVLGLMSGIYPAWKMSRLNPVQALKGTR